MTDTDKIAVLNAALTRMQRECNAELERRRAAEELLRAAQAGQRTIFEAWTRDLAELKELRAECAELKRKACGNLLKQLGMLAQPDMRAQLLGARDALENVVDFAQSGSPLIRTAQHRIGLINKFLQTEAKTDDAN